MVLKINTKNVDSLRFLLNDWLPDYVKSFDLPKTYKYNFGENSILGYHFEWKDIKYDPIKFRTEDFAMWVQDKYIDSLGNEYNLID